MAAGSHILKFFTKWSDGKTALVAMSPVIVQLVSMKQAILGLWLLIILDLITGIRKNFHKNNVPFDPSKASFWKSIKSYALRQTWRKTTEYGVGILVIVIFETLIFGFTPVELAGKSFTISELFIVLPAGIEIYSIMENMEEVSGVNILSRVKGFLPPALQGIFSKPKKVNEESNTSSE